MLQDALILTKHVQQAAIIDIQNQSAKATSVGFMVRLFFILWPFGIVKSIRLTNIEVSKKKRKFF